MRGDDAFGVICSPDLIRRVLLPRGAVYPVGMLLRCGGGIAAV